MAKTLLLADDSVTIQKVVGISFASEDIEITTVDNGDDAVTRARELVPDIVLADAVMPGLSGYEVCEAIKSEPGLAHIPVILLTGTFEAFDAERAERAGAAGHVSKPFEAQTLVDRVKELLASAPPPAPIAAPSAPTPATGDGAPAPAFDFSDDEDFASPELREARADDALEAEPLEFDDSDAAFSFDEDELAGALAAPAEPPPPGPDATQLMPPIPAPAEELVEPADLAQATLLDPAAASGYDVSSSDLGPPPRTEEDPVLAALASRGDEISEPTPRPYGAASELEASPGAESTPLEASAWDSGPAELEVESAPAAAAPIEVGAVEEGAPPLLEAPLEPPATEGPALEAEPLDVSDVGAITDPFPEEREAAVAGDEPVGLAAVAGDAPVDPATVAGDAPVEPVDFAATPEPSGAGGETALTPELRRELSDTLEKIAWDAFGPVTEKIVAQALERVEQVVWEVVPQIAETLIQEEIRRLKDDGDAE